jgi:hypothetical protein
MRTRSAFWIPVIAAACLAASAACSSSSGSGPAGGGQGGNSGSTGESGASCTDVCNNLQTACPAAYTSTCVSECAAMNESSAELQCGATAASCSAVLACQTSSGTDAGGGGSDTGGSSGGGSAECHSVDGPDYTSYTCQCGGSTIIGCSNGAGCDVCEGLGTCVSCQANP